MKSVTVQELTKIRQYLHSNPELSGEEKHTSEYILKQLETTKPDKLLTCIGGYGLIAFYEGYSRGKTIAVRVDMDALPIAETNELSYKSKVPGVMHACGHDGHSTIGIGTAKEISEMRDSFKGTVAILFQPAEETGTGAAKMMSDTKMKDVHFDKIFALHNLPGFKKQQVLVRHGIFASSSIGLKVELHGATSHAGHPEEGNSPILGMTSLIDSLNKLPQNTTPLHRSTLVTIIHARLGEIAFGTTPGYATVMATLRAHDDQDLEKMQNKVKQIVKGLAKAYELRYEMEWLEYFPSVKNEKSCVDKVVECSNALGLDIHYLEHPFAWSEDFSVFSQSYDGVLFGLGAGREHPKVHNGNYDFPDELLETGVNLFLELINKNLK